MTEAYDGRQVVGMDLHRRRSVLVRMTEDGRKLETVRIENSPQALRAVLARAGKNPRVVVEATYGWHWAVDVLEEAGAEVHLAHPLGVRAFTYRRVKDDERDAADLAGLLRMGRLPEARARAAGDPRAARADPLPASWSGSAPRAGIRCTPCWTGSACRSPIRTSSACTGRRGWTACACRSRTRARSPRCGS
jgi:Transposase